jgi:hypothetical protein
VTIFFVGEGYSGLLGRLRERLLGPLGKLPVDVRRDILEGRIVDGALNAFVVKVRANAASIEQRDIDALERNGYDDDEIFDAAVCAAFHEGEHRYAAALKAIEDAPDAS